MVVLITCIGCQQETPPAPTADAAPPAFDIWLYDLSTDGVRLNTRVTNRDGYDNQPMFTSDSNHLLFSSDRAGRVHTHLYDIAEGTITQLNETEADKYSPTPIPGTNDTQFSVVHSDSITFQGLWKYAVDGSSTPAPITDVDAVAYFTWAGPEHVLFWRLGEPNTLQLLNSVDGDTTVLDQGRVVSLHPIPGESASSYIIVKGEEPAKIKRFDWETQISSTIVQAVEGADYFCWTPSGDLLMINDNMLYTHKPGSDDDWALKAELEIEGGTRLAVSPDGRKLAVVGVH